jgi:hypothetical protein
MALRTVINPFFRENTKEIYGEKKMSNEVIYPIGISYGFTIFE